MAPTEILADQHARSILRILGDAGADVRVSVLTGSLKAAARRRALTDIGNGHAQLVIGTHALFESGVEFARLGMVVVDEQQRFGVMQRLALSSKGTRPDVLVMTATPIPRSLALTLYGDLDLSVIDELPPGRTPVTTVVQAGRRPREGLRWPAPGDRRGPPGLRRRAARRRNGGFGPEGRDGVRRPPQEGRLPLARDRPRARAFEGRREGPRHAGFRPRRDPDPGRHDRHRGRRRRAERLRDGRRARRAVRPVAASPASRARRPRGGEIVLRADGRGRSRGGNGPGAPENHGSDVGRLQDRRKRPRASRAGGRLRHAAARPFGPAVPRGDPPRSQAYSKRHETRRCASPNPAAPSRSSPAWAPCGGSGSSFRRWVRPGATKVSPPS